MLHMPVTCAFNIDLIKKCVHKYQTFFCVFVISTAGFFLRLPVTASFSAPQGPSSKSDICCTHAYVLIEETTGYTTTCTVVDDQRHAQHAYIHKYLRRKKSRSTTPSQAASTRQMSRRPSPHASKKESGLVPSTGSRDASSGSSANRALMKVASWYVCARQGGWRRQRAVFHVFSLVSRDQPRGKFLSLLP